MEVKLELPDDLEIKGTLWLFHGDVVIAAKRPERDWVIKTGYCSMCGCCCSASHIKGLPTKDGWCAYLVDHPTEKNKRICDLGHNRPFACAIGIPWLEPDCTLKWEHAENDDSKSKDKSYNNQT